MCSRHCRVATGRADLARRQQRHGRHRVERESLQPRADQVLLIHQEGGQLVISLRSRAMHLAGAPALTARALSDDARHGAARRVAASRAQHGRRPLRRLCAAATDADVGDTPRIVQPRLISSSTQWGFHFPRPTRCDTATCKPGTDPWRRSFYSHPSTTWPSRTPASVMSALAAMACVGRRAQLDVLDVVRAKRSRTPRTTASRRRLPSPGGPWGRLGGT